MSVKTTTYWCAVGALLLSACVTEGTLDRDGDGHLPREAGGRDCDDRDANISPDATERCGNGVDDDCDDLIDEDGEGSLTWFIDGDGDGWGVESNSREACSQPDNASDQAGDCDDTNPGIHPGQVDDTCDQVDDDCDGDLDEDTTPRAWHADQDGDGFGSDAAVQDCRAPAGHVAQAGDCNDADDRIYPGAPERCNGLDDNCTLGADEGVLGSGRACPADTCVQVHEARPEVGQVQAWIDAGDRLIEVTCVELPRHGRGWMRLDLELAHREDLTTMEKGSRFSLATWRERTDESGSTVRWVELEPGYAGGELDARYARVTFNLPYEVQEFLGTFTLEPLMPFTGPPHRGLDNGRSEWGGIQPLGQGNVIFGILVDQIKPKRLWGSDWSGAAEAPVTFDAYDASGATIYALFQPDDALMLEVNGTAGTSPGGFSGANLVDLDVYLR